MARENKLPQTGPAADDPVNPADPTKRRAEDSDSTDNGTDTKKPKRDEPLFFETTIAKYVEREVEDEKGNKTTEWVEVMSDNLYPGEKTKAEYDAEQAEKKAKAKEDADKSK